VPTFDAGSIEGSVDLNVSPFNDALDRVLFRAQEFDDKTFTARVELGGTAQFASELDKLKAKLDEFKNKAASAKAQVNVDRLEFDRLLRDLAIFGASRYVARVKVDGTAEAIAEVEALKRALAGLRDANANVNVSGGGGTFSGMSGIITAIIMLLPVLASGLGAVIGLVGALGSALVIAGVGFAALAAVAMPAMNQIMEAAKKGQSGIDALPPALRQAGQEFLNLKKTLTDIESAAGGKVGLMLATAFKTVADILRTLQPVILAAADAFTMMMQKVDAFFKSAQWQSFAQFLVGTMSPVVGALIDGFLALLGAILNLSQAFYNFGGVVILDQIVGALQDFNKWTSELGHNQGFIDFMQAIMSAIPPVMTFIGQLIEFISHLMVALIPLGNVILNVANAFLFFVNNVPPSVLGPLALGIVAVVSALTGFGGPVLLVVAGISAVVLALINLYNNVPAVHDAIDSMVSLLRDWFVPLWDHLVQLWRQYVIPAWDSLMKRFQDPAVQSGLKSLGDLFVQKVLPALSNLAEVVVRDVIPALLHFYDAIAPLVGFLASVAITAIINGITAAIREIAGALQMASGIINLVIDLLTGNWDAAWKDAGQVVDGFLTIIAALFGTDLPHLKQFFVDLWTNVSTWFVNLWTTVKDWFIQRWTDISDFAVFIWTHIRDFFVSIFDGIVNWFKQRWTDISDFFTTVSQAISDVNTAIWTGIRDFFVGIWNWIADLAQTVWGAITDYFHRFFEAHRELIMGIWNAISDFLTTIWTFISDTATTVWNAISGFFQTIWKAISDFWTMIWTGISDFFTTTWGNISSTGESIWTSISNFFTNAWNQFTAAWTNFWTMIGNFFDQIWQSISAFAVQIWNSISSFFQGAWSAFTSAWNSFWTAIGNFFQSIWNAIRDFAINIWNAITNFFSPAFKAFGDLWNSTWTNVKTFFSDTWNSISDIARSVWDNVTNFFKEGVNKAIDVLNWFIGATDGSSGINAALHFFLIPTIPNIPKLESGGVIDQEVKYFASGGLFDSVGPGFMTNGPKAIVGEGDPRYPEYVIPTDPKYRDNALRLLQDLSPRMMAEGGVVGAANAAPGGGFNLGNILGWVNGLIGGVGGMFQQDSFIGKMGSGVVDKIKGGILDKINGAIQAAIAAAAAAAAAAARLIVGGGGGGAAQWESVILQVLGELGQSADLLGAVERRINFESGGNPNAINLTDSNAQAGHPSQGLMQTIPSTFAAYAGPYAGAGITDPHANIYAGLNYAIHRYGSIAAIDPLNMPSGYDSGGMLKPGMTLAINRSGAPERVLNADHTSKLDAMLSGAGSNTALADKLDQVKELLAKNGAGATIHIHDISGDPAETANRAIITMRTH
jgi:SLT domain-containing protein/phage-related protein